jgi:hypothetical protein
MTLYLSVSLMTPGWLHPVLVSRLWDMVKGQWLLNTADLCQDLQGPVDNLEQSTKLVWLIEFFKKGVNYSTLKSWGMQNAMNPIYGIINNKIMLMLLIFLGNVLALTFALLYMPVNWHTMSKCSMNTLVTVGDIWTEVLTYWWQMVNWLSTGVLKLSCGAHICFVTLCKRVDYSVTFL